MNPDTADWWERALAEHEKDLVAGARVVVRLSGECRIHAHPNALREADGEVGTVIDDMRAPRWDWPPFGEGWPGRLNAAGHWWVVRFDYAMRGPDGIATNADRFCAAELTRQQPARGHERRERIAVSDWTVSEYDVILESVGDRRVEVMRALRQSIQMKQIADARDMLEGVPRVVLADGDRERAFPLARSLFEAGADVRVVQTSREYPAGCWVGDGGPEPIGDPVVQEVPREWWLRSRP